MTLQQRMFLTTLISLAACLTSLVTVIIAIFGKG